MFSMTLSVLEFPIQKVNDDLRNGVTHLFEVARCCSSLLVFYQYRAQVQRMVKVDPYV